MPLKPSSYRNANSAKKWIRRRITEFSQALGLYGIARRIKAGPIVLYYHGVEETIVDPLVQEIHLPFPIFEKQIEYLRRHFDIISLPYLLECLNNGYRIDPASVVLTFDDGYKNNREIVGPYLKSLEIPFAVFISTNHIDRGIRFPTYYLRAGLFSTERPSLAISSLNASYDLSSREKRVAARAELEFLLKRSSQDIVRQILKDLITLIPADRWPEVDGLFHSDEPMNWDDVRSLAAAGAVIGSHCHDHFILHSKQKPAEIEEQIRTSKKLIEEHIGECRYITYPEGGRESLDFRAIQASWNNKYELGFTSLSGEIYPPIRSLILPRLGISDDLDHFQFNVNTSFRFNAHYRRWSSQFDRFPDYERQGMRIRV